MFQVGDYVVYKRDVCKIKEIRKNHLRDQDYYILCPIDDPSLIIDVPVENRLGFLRSPISKGDALKLIEKIPTIEVIDCNNRTIENEYRALLQSNQLEDLIKIIKTTYLRNEERTKNGKKIGEKDNMYFKNAEKYLYNELSISLDLSFDDTRKYIIDQVQNVQNNNV